MAAARTLYYASDSFHYGQSRDIIDSSLTGEGCCPAGGGLEIPQWAIPWYCPMWLTYHKSTTQCPIFRSGVSGLGLWVATQTVKAGHCGTVAMLVYIHCLLCVYIHRITLLMSDSSISILFPHYKSKGLDSSPELGYLRHWRYGRGHCVMEVATMAIVYGMATCLSCILLSKASRSGSC